MKNPIELKHVTNAFNDTLEVFKDIMLTDIVIIEIRRVFFAKLEKEMES